MQQFDYSVPQTTSDELNDLIVNLSRSEIEHLLESVKEIKSHSKQTFCGIWEKVIESAIIPLLKRYAEHSFSVLETDFQTSDLFVATLKNERGFDICNDISMKYLLVLSECIEIKTHEGWTILSLIFSANQY